MAYVIEAPVVQKETFPHGSCTLSVRAAEIAKKCRPGQFVMVGHSTEHESFPLLKRALAIYSREPEDPSVIRLLLKIVGEGTRQLAALEPTDIASIVGPLGNGFDLSTHAGRAHLLVAGGTGIASVYLLAEDLLRSGEEVHLLYGGRTHDDLIGLKDFERLGLDIFATTDDGSYGFHGLVTDGLNQYLERFSPKELNLFTCGPTPMMKAVAGIAEERQIPCQISVEVKMACGFGVCLGCSVRTTRGNRLACSHGPVFPADEFVWEPSWK